MTKRDLTIGYLAPSFAVALARPAAKTKATLLNEIDLALERLKSTDATAFNAKYYLAQNPDIAAAGVDPQGHYEGYGKWEGRLPYAGAPKWQPRADEMIFAPGPIVDIPDVYVPAGRTEAVVTLALTRGYSGGPCERSWWISAAPANGTDPASGGRLGLGDFAPLDQQNFMVLPCQGSRLQVKIKITHPEAQGWFSFVVQCKNGPIWQARCRVYLNTTPPNGYVYPEYVKPKPALLPPTIGTPTWSTDFLDDAIITAGMHSQYGLNAMVGRFAPWGSKTVSGKSIDCFPMVTDDKGQRVRAIRTVNCRGDQMVGNDGRLYDYACGGLLLPAQPVRGLYWFDGVVPGFKGMDNGVWGIKPDGSWPPELDVIEKWPGAETTNFHGITNATQTFHRPPSETRRKTIWQRKDGRFLLWYDDYDGRGPQLAVECPDYMLDWAIDLNLTTEGPGGAGGEMDAGLDYGLNRILAYDAGFAAA